MYDPDMIAMLNTMPSTAVEFQKMFAKFVHIPDHEADFSIWNHIGHTLSIKYLR